MSSIEIDDDIHLEVELELMLEDHPKEPLAARWHMLGSMLASLGYSVLGYEADYFYAERRDKASGKVAESFVVDVEEDGTAYWTYRSPYGVGPGEVEDLDNLQEESDSSDAWFDVLGDLVLLWRGA